MILDYGDVELEMYNEEPWELKGRGWAYVVKITKLAEHLHNSGELGKFLRQQKLGEQQIIGVEMFATISQHVGRNISLLVGKKL